MTKDQLKIKLINNQIPKEVYSLDGRRPNEAYCLNYVNGKWETYYSERGIKSEREEFDNENDACNYFYKWLIESLKSMGII
ncbi:hypothetical protein BJV85_001846 [Clostridium acetobutylicum]|uniref:Uncharacterized protein n=1 Tax=Clostridium acetobutylicum (strain ATCC 824 / DSM 792 / JCM 1419 / IAM 19013 / LMG 5710 / NBRC 13948 / NRRL B-527 / VKM B-1787 / 2291 / W) TaxID=272562 RepID=Q97HI0_CLOAB|nr:MULTISPECIES: hypothetical protein [Clostridium]AAK79990.1 Hypothetical protein CA_C2031 [Clostridium acetobutylicum ATCC 824]ADZ21082.1 Conserved hypothetical protein [Clostridium acetobutylicum EA 2018]AEI32138.1 hypothetical protein SMB_G2063 [Clostridium acetobutylicum DSM 1731]AWV79580.1 hypothetical protein DK921_05590 [Clostridium acetobutylicum]MBC2394446.1 hypothetical protein [Clostridium acetobutylicum]